MKLPVLKSTHTRLTELTAGIVANLVYNGAASVEQALRDNISLDELIVKTDDSLALYQLFRVLRGSCYKFSNGSMRSLYRQLNDSRDWTAKIGFILENSINQQLLNEVVLFIHDVKVLNEDDGSTLFFNLCLYSQHYLKTVSHSMLKQC